MMNIDNWINTYLTPNNIIIILILFLIILSSIIIVLILTSLKEAKTEKQILDEKKDFDLKDITKMLEENMNSEKFLSVSEYENEQEKKAIISYDELLKNASSLTINYEDEPIDGVKVRKVEIEKDESNNMKIKTPDLENRSFYSYEKEEEFLKTLKQFRANL